MSRIIWFATLVALLSSASILLVAADNHPCQGGVVPSLPPKPKVGNSGNNGYGGIVTEVTKDSITIQWINSPDEKPRTFALTETLAGGKIPSEPFRPGFFVFPIDMYRITDVKVGDLVEIGYARWNG